MCGLFLVIERDRPVERERAEQATQALRHRGPDAIGQYTFERVVATPAGACKVSGFVGHTRLSILDPRARSAQPFRRGPHTLVYNGEIYNFKALRQDLARRGMRFDTDGDTEVLLGLLTTDGVDALNRANGMWALCLLDEQTGSLMAARDRYGKKPLFYYADASTLCMASEIGPILSYLGRTGQWVGADLDSFLRDGWLFPNADGATHVAGIRQVMAGAVLRFDLASWRTQERRYFDLDAFAAAGADPGTALVDLIEDAVCARLVADRQVGLLLSGGVDSSLILSVLAARGLAEQVTCFTGDAGKSDDAEYARLCVEQLGIRSVNLPLDYSGASMDGFLRVCRHQEKPFPFIGNALAMPQLYAHIASHDVPVVLDGTGGDEIFAGYWERYYRFALAQALADDNQAWIAESLRANADQPKVHAIIAQAIHAARSDAAPGVRPSGIVRATEDPGDLDDFVVPAVRQATSQDPLSGFRGSLAQALVTDAARGRLHEWLWQNDRNAMMSGIENRSPLLDYRLAPYMCGDYRDKFVGGWNKHQLRRAFPLALPTQWRRDKQGFRWVYHRFLQHNRTQVLEIIAASRVLPQRVDVARLLDAARRDESYLGCGLLQRSLCIAGLEQTMRLDGISEGAPSHA